MIEWQVWIQIRETWNTKSKSDWFGLYLALTHPYPQQHHLHCFWWTETALTLSELKQHWYWLDWWTKLTDCLPCIALRAPTIATELFQCLASLFNALSHVFLLGQHLNLRWKPSPPNSTQRMQWHGLVCCTHTCIHPSLTAIFHSRLLICSLHWLWNAGCDPQPIPNNSRGIWMRLTGGVCGVYYTFPGCPHFEWRGPLTLWSATTHTHHPYHPSWVLRSHCTCTHPWTTVEPLEPVWPLVMDHSRALRASVAPCHVTGTTDQADRVTPGSGPLNPISHHSTLIWQPPIIKHRIVKPGECW